MRHPDVVSIEAQAEQMRDQLARSLDAVRQRFPSELPPVLVAVVERLLANYDAVLERQRDASRYTLVHRLSSASDVLSDRAGRPLRRLRLADGDGGARRRRSGPNRDDGFDDSAARTTRPAIDRALPCGPGQERCQ